MASGTNSGVHGKFQERLKRMKLIRAKRFQKQEIQEKFVRDQVNYIRLVVRNTPPISTVSPPKVGNVSLFEEKKVIHRNKKDLSKIVEQIRTSAMDRGYVRVKGVVPLNPVKITSQKKNDFHLGKENLENKENLSYGDNSILKENIPNLREKESKSDKKILRGNFLYKNIHQRIRNDVSKMDEDSKKKLIEQLEEKILDTLKINFEDKLDQLEVLESELFLIHQKQDQEVELKRVRKIKKRINEMIDEINQIIEQYNLFKRNYYIDHLVGIDDSVLVDDIIDYRILVDSLDGEKKFVHEFQKLDKFRSLYHNLVGIKHDVEQLQEDNLEKIEEFDVRDKKYDQVKMDMVNVADINRNCLLEMKKQDQYFSELMQKIHQIDSETYTTYHLRGFGQLVHQSLRYVGFLLLSPFGGLLPGITMQTMVTRNLIGNLRHNMHFEEREHIRYQTVDYSFELSSHLTDVSYTADLINQTLRDIEHLKEDFMLQYDSKILGYEQTLKDIDQIQHIIVRNQNKVEIIKKNLIFSKKINDEKVVKVRRLNEQQN